MLDQDQLKVVDSTEGPWAVMAGPGSGKSTTLLHRAARIDNLHLGSCLCLTFTNEAAKSLRTRAGKMFPNVNQAWFSTLHSLALKFAHDHATAFPFHLADNPLAIDGLAASAAFDSMGELNYNAFTSWVSLQKRKRISPGQAVMEAEKTGVKLDYAIAYKRYQDKLKKQGLLDFDDLIYYMVDVLESRPDIRSKNQYQYLMMDEAQDACELDWRILQLLSEKHGNVMCVGDCGQAIYGFRGGVSDHFLNMPSYFPGTRKLYLGNNYRSTKNIVDYVKKSAPYEEISEHFEAVTEEEGVIPTVTAYSTDSREAEEVVKKAQEYGIEDCAVLCRTNLGLRAVEEECLNQGVKYHVLGTNGFWEAREVQAILAYVRCVVTLSDNAIISAIQAPFHPSKYLKKKIVIEQIKERIVKGESAWTALDHVSGVSGFKDFIKKLYPNKYSSSGDAVRSIVSDLKAISFYREEENINPDNNPVENIKEIIKVADRYESLEDFLDFTRRIQYSSKEKKGLCLSTIHQSKGKEWPHVFVISVNSGILPHEKSENLEEEKCIFYTAVSRPMKTLDISYYGCPSIFLQLFREKENICDEIVLT